MNDLLATITPYFEITGVRESAIALATILVAVVVRLGFSRVMLRWTRKTETTADDELVNACRRPVIVLILLAGLAMILSGLDMPDTMHFVVMAVIKTGAVLLLGTAVMRSAKIILEALSRQVHRVSIIQPKTLPLMEMVIKIVIAGAAVYFFFVAWNIDVTTWLASAGIVGIAVGFAAKDTLANLFSGIFILADAPYQIDDFIILDNGLRGVVKEIGIRSTRILTRDDIEVTVPNAVIAGSKIINETSGRHQKMRVRVKVGVAYGSDTDQVREVLLSCVDGVQHVEDDPPPRVRFRSFGNSSLDFELLAWIEEPLFRGRVLDALNDNVYKAFAATGIEIPYSKMDVFIKHEGGDDSPEP